MRLKKNSSVLITVSVPTYNEEKSIKRCLESLIKQDIRAGYEILVEDGHSTDKTKEIIKNLQKGHPEKIILLDNPHRFLSYASNIGLKKAKGQFFARFDAHAFAPPDYLKNCLLTFKKLERIYPNLVAVGGKWAYGGSAPLQKATYLSANSFFGGARSTYRFSKKPALVQTIPYGFYLTEALRKVRGWDTNFNLSDDAELNWKLIKSGYCLYFEPKIISSYESRVSFLQFAQQLFRYGTVIGHLTLKHSDSFRIINLIPLIFGVYITLLPFLYFWPLYFLPAFLYLLVNFYFTLKISAQEKFWPGIFLLPLCFLIIHFCFGWGMLAGIIQEIKLREKRNI
jgi:cellulose synthase/poly-beta-1,6-N-acetylglucosamine synthase-like glycosyltransferase